MRKTEPKSRFYLILAPLKSSRISFKLT